MTTVDILYRYATPPTEIVAMALAGTRDVYGIRRTTIDSDARTLRVEFDATRLNAATVTRLMKQTGLEIVEEVSLAVQAVMPEPAPAPPPAAAPATTVSTPAPAVASTVGSSAPAPAVV